MENPTTLDIIELREKEIASYELNIEVYKSIASSLPSEWPARLLEFKGSKNKHEDIAKIDDLDDVELVSDLWAFDEAQAMVRSEMVEKRKSQAILAALKAQI